MRLLILVLGFTGIFTIGSVAISQIGSFATIFDTIKDDSTPTVCERLGPGIQKERPTTVPFCDLVTRPDSFDNKIVRVRAIYESTWEWKRLYDETCLGPQNYVWPVFECDTIEACEIVRKSLEKGMVGDPFKGQKVDLTLVGRFLGLQESKQRYGVQGGLQFQLEIIKIEEIKRIPTRPRKLIGATGD